MAFKFLKTGAASAQLAQKAAAERAAQLAEQGKMFRFWLKDGEEARITFIDGDLSPDGFLLPPRFYEHNLYLNGSWNNQFVCPEKTDPAAKDKCPICESGDKPALVALFTIIDHRQFKGKNDKIYKDTKKLLVAKTQSFEMLNKLAMKLGGLSGQTFDVSRTGDKAAAVGSLFIPVEKKPIADLKKLYTVDKIDPTTNIKKKITNFEPADYEKEITYRTGDQLRDLLKLAKDQGPSNDSGAGGAANYEDQL